MIEKFDLNSTCTTSVDGIHWVYHPTKNDILEKINELIDAVNMLEPKKHGRWMHDGDGLVWCYRCGFGKERSDERPYRYCPNCGASMMDEVENG